MISDKPIAFQRKNEKNEKKEEKRKKKDGKQTSRTLSVSQPPLPSLWIRERAPLKKQPSKAEWASALPSRRTRATLSAVSLRVVREARKWRERDRESGTEEMSGMREQTWRTSFFVLY